jgi:hypothetical protein
MRYLYTVYREFHCTSISFSRNHLIIFLLLFNLCQAFDKSPVDAPARGFKTALILSYFILYTTLEHERVVLSDVLYYIIEEVFRLIS